MLDFYIFLLDLHNLTISIMKKSIIALLISALVLATTIVWLLNVKITIGFQAITQYVVILIIIAFGFYFGFSRIKSEKRGEPAEDELSKKILQKASSISFYVSLYIWLGVMYFSDKTKLETHTLIGTGILGMAIVFCACWVIFKIRGLRDV